MTTPQRVSAIDATKGLAILGVLFVHMGFTSRFDTATLGSIATLQRIFAWCVLAFFFASGFFHPDTKPVGSWQDFAKKRARRLLVPCLAFSWVYKLALLGLASSGLTPSPFSEVRRNVVEILREAFTPATPQFYFLAYLFFIAVAIHAMLRLQVLRSDFSRWLLAAILLQSYWILPLERPHGESLSQLPLYAATYLLGIQFAKLAHRLDGSRNAHALGAAVLVASLLAVAVYRPQILHLVPPLLISQLATCIPRWPQIPFAFLGRRSGAIYAWHTPLVMPLLSVLLTKFSLTGVPLILAMIIATLVISLTLDSLVRRFDTPGFFRL